MAPEPATPQPATPAEDSPLVLTVNTPASKRKSVAFASIPEADGGEHLRVLVRVRPPAPGDVCCVEVAGAAEDADAIDADFSGTYLYETWGGDYEYDMTGTIRVERE